MKQEVKSRQRQKSSDTNSEIRLIRCSSCNKSKLPSFFEPSAVKVSLETNHAVICRECKRLKRQGTRSKMRPPKKPFMFTVYPEKFNPKGL